MRDCSINGLNRVLDADKTLTHPIGMSIISTTPSVPQYHRD